VAYFFGHHVESIRKAATTRRTIHVGHGPQSLRGMASPTPNLRLHS